jgi:lysozyme
MIPDLSHWQSISSFAAMKESGVETVILKATQGSYYIDPTFVMRVAAFQAQGIEVRAYHFMDATDPGGQMRHFLAVAGGLKKLALDVEKNGVSGGTPTVMQAAQAVSELHALSGILPAIYIGRYGPDGRGTGLPNAVLSRCPLWLPEYGGNPVVPAGWEGSGYALWQYTDGVHGVVGDPVAGVVGGRCDLSRGDW